MDFGGGGKSHEQSLVRTQRQHDTSACVVQSPEGTGLISIATYTTVAKELQSPI